MTKAQIIVTASSIDQMLAHNNPHYVAAAIGRALVALLKRQTEEEQNTSATLLHNGIGFTGADARSATITAKYYRRHGTLLAWQIEAWAKKGKSGHSRLAKYHKQLNEIAIQKVQVSLPLERRV